ncbi:MAG TPA: 23S rRNA (adenine(2503)-C(2))-methyltransferase RlmN [Tepidisphaeraceae bacterium]|nr:23S rRNA (adenine(2503)-C(2))-methyltransferase RlmN [Tepidisphaeraceae bacterium]
MSSDANTLRQAAFFGLDAARLTAALAADGWPKFRAAQVLDWVYRKGVTDPHQMSNLSKLDRQKLVDRFTFVSATVEKDQLSTDGTRKLLLSWQGGAQAETVMIPDADRRTACVSSQVGCPVGCRFCASGVNGVKGNLTADQIVEQVVAFNKLLAPAGEHITNLVFMGMGEPLANYKNVMQAIRVLHDPKCLNMGARRLTISTVGVPPRIRDLAKEELPLNLALSLHAPNESLRRELIPWAEHFALDDILAACRYYFEKTGREITLEYILLSGVNDEPGHARQLAVLCRTLRANVNLIRYNEVEGLPYFRPKGEAVVKFQDVLRANGINAHVRKSRGRDIDAACGQLRRKQQGEQLVTIGSAPSTDAADEG